jgi:hypothetical protein
MLYVMNLLPVHTAEELRAKAARVERLAEDNPLEFAQVLRVAAGPLPLVACAGPYRREGGGQQQREQDQRQRDIADERDDGEDEQVRRAQRAQQGRRDPVSLHQR